MPNKIKFGVLRNNQSDPNKIQLKINNYARVGFVNFR